MARAEANIGTTNYVVAILAGHHELSADESLEFGGQDAGPAPYELLCSALCACTAITLRMYADRKQWPLSGVHVDAHFKRTDNEEGIDRALKFEGALNDDQRARLADIAERTPVTLTLKQGIRITTTFKSESP
jgi:putative redox protein